MKKNLWKVAALSMMMVFSAQSHAQSLGDVLNAIGSQQGSDIAQGLTSIFSSEKQATAEKLVGTWVYTEPAIVFTSDNILAKAASKIAANKVEKKLQEQLSKYGIQPGTFSYIHRDSERQKDTRHMAGERLKTDSVDSRSEGSFSYHADRRKRPAVCDRCHQVAEPV